MNLNQPIQEQHVFTVMVSLISAYAIGIFLIVM